MQPEIRYLIPCWKEPTMVHQRPSANEIMYSIRAKSGLQYSAWQRTYYVLAVLSNLHGKCQFRVELRLEEVDADSTIQQSDTFTHDSGNDPLRVQPISIMMKPVELPKAGVYQVCFVWNGIVLAKTPIHAR